MLIGNVSSNAYYNSQDVRDLLTPENPEEVDVGVDALLAEEDLPPRPILSFDEWLAEHPFDQEWLRVFAAEELTAPWYRRPLRTFQRSLRAVVHFFRQL